MQEFEVTIHKNRFTGPGPRSVKIKWSPLKPLSFIEQYFLNASVIYDIDGERENVLTSACLVFFPVWHPLQSGDHTKK